MTTQPRGSNDADAYGALRTRILNDEGAYCEAVNWMGAKAQAEGKHTYVEGGKVWHKNAEELTADGYLDKYIEYRLSQEQSEDPSADESEGCRP